jgi:hypothetical protein
MLRAFLDQSRHTQLAHLQQNFSQFAVSITSTGWWFRLTCLEAIRVPVMTMDESTQWLSQFQISKEVLLSADSAASNCSAMHAHAGADQYLSGRFGSASLE